MKVLVFYRPDSEHARGVEELVHDLQEQHNLDQDHLVLCDVDTRDGQWQAEIYDIVAYPAILVVGDDGGFIKSWTDGSLPRAEEIASYVYST